MEFTALLLPPGSGSPVAIKQHARLLKLRNYNMIDPAEEHFLFVVRVMQFQNIYTVYTDHSSGKYVPSVGGMETAQGSYPDRASLGEMGITLMFLLYAFFYSLVEDSDDGLDAFRIWRYRYPEHEEAIVQLESVVLPLRADLRIFRNRLGFHGSRSYAHESKGFDLFNRHSGDKLLKVMQQFKALNAAFLEWDIAKQISSRDRENEARIRIDSVIANCTRIGI